MHLFDHKYSAIVILWNNINNSFLLEYIFIMNFIPVMAKLNFQQPHDPSEIIPIFAAQ